MFTKLNTTLTEQLTRERDRADRLEEELHKLNDAVRNEYITTISKTTQVVSDAFDVIQRNR